MRLLLLCLLLMCLAPAQETAAPTRPNLVVIVTDDQRFDQMGCAGHAVLQTPHMDSLAERGVRFTNAFVTTPICAASRASLMSSRWEGSHGYTFGKQPMSQSLAGDTYFAQLRRHGYQTSFVGKWGVRMEKGARANLFDHFHSMSPPYLKEGKAHLTERTADTAIELLPKDASGAPFCMTISFNAPHAEDPHPDQFIPPPELAKLYENAEVPPPPLAEEGFDALPSFLAESLGRRRWTWRFDSREKQIQRTKDYWRMITGVDQAIGRVLEELETRGLADNTVVLFTSDNGFFLGERGLAGKWFIYEESIRVPFIIFDPRAKPETNGTTRDFMALNVDLAPTLLELAGAPVPNTYEGESLVPFLSGKSAPQRSEFLVEHHFDHKEIPKSVGLRGERWVYSLYYEEDPPYEQLFDLNADPNQLRNLAEDASSDSALRKVLLEHRSRCVQASKVEPAAFR